MLFLLGLCGDLVASARPPSPPGAPAYGAKFLAMPGALDGRQDYITYTRAGM